MGTCWESNCIWKFLNLNMRTLSLSPALLSLTTVRDLQLQKFFEKVLFAPVLHSIRIGCILLAGFCGHLTISVGGTFSDHGGLQFFDCLHSHRDKRWSFRSHLCQIFGIASRKTFAATMSSCFMLCFMSLSWYESLYHGLVADGGHLDASYIRKSGLCVLKWPRWMILCLFLFCFDFTTCMFYSRSGFHFWPVVISA